MSILRQFFTSSIKNILNAVVRPSVTLVTMKPFSSKSAAQHIVWVDLEMTGLDIHKDHILEIACLITDAELNIVATGPNIIINQPDNILDNMNQWCITQHGESGLTEASRKSKISVCEAEQEILNFVRAHVPEKRCPLGGNSVYMDRLFLREYMPTLDEYLHYRIIDVSTIKELAKRWYPRDFSRIPQKKFQHRCMSDIMESIEEMKYYREHIFKQSN
ncbi:probable oligoribonuclease [Epargyreus clarus]|uniref:probable oligoribonuclease n=1 Tax=Epargyreus clarus TaxID=520877 RepID=UPI003C309411